MPIYLSKFVVLKYMYIINLCTFTSSYVLNTLHFGIKSFVILPINNCMTYLLFILFSYEINVIESVSLHLLEFNETRMSTVPWDYSRSWVCAILSHLVLSIHVPLQKLLVSFSYQFTINVNHFCGQPSYGRRWSDRSTYHTPNPTVTHTWTFMVKAIPETPFSTAQLAAQHRYRIPLAWKLLCTSFLKD